LRTARVAVAKGGAGNASDDGSGGTKPSES